MIGWYGPDGNITLPLPLPIPVFPEISLTATPPNTHSLCVATMVTLKSTLLAGLALAAQQALAVDLAVKPTGGNKTSPIFYGLMHEVLSPPFPSPIPPPSLTPGP